MDFYHGFKTGFGPWETRNAGGQDAPTGEDCARVNSKGHASLFIKDNPLRTGHIHVPAEEFTVETGFVEARVKFPHPKGAHSAFWLQSVTPYATEDDHEVDIAEYFGNPNVVHHSLWMRDETGEIVQPFKGTKKFDATTWHTYGVELRSGSYTFTVDDQEIDSTKVYGSTVKKTMILSILTDTWERKNLQVDNLGLYKFFCDWVRVSPL